MLRVAYINQSEPVEKPKKLTPKQQLMQEAIETIAILNHQDHLKALKKYATRIKELDLKKEYLKKLQNG